MNLRQLSGDVIGLHEQIFFLNSPTRRLSELSSRPSCSSCSFSGMEVCSSSSCSSSFGRASSDGSMTLSRSTAKTASLQLLESLSIFAARFILQILQTLMSGRRQSTWKECPHPLKRRHIGL